MDNINFFTDEDYPELCTWFEMRGLPAPTLNLLPQNGMFVPGIAAGFLYLTDSSLAILDVFIANPMAQQKDRDNALNTIAVQLTNLAKVHGCEMIVCDSRLDSIKGRATMLGFTYTGEHSGFAKEL